MATDQPRQPNPTLEQSLTKKEAWEVTGGLSDTSKMPCHSWGLPATSCHTGARLATLEDTVCSDCYAKKGNYTWPNVHQANTRRLARATHPDWEDAMATLINWQARRSSQPFFRWFDTGDLQSPSMLERIATVAHNTPEIHHWLPTREHGMVRDVLAHDRLPQNLTLRLSAHYVDGEPPRLLDLPTSTVHRHEAPVGYSCPAYENHPIHCGECRTCWDPTIQNISYRFH